MLLVSSEMTLGILLTVGDEFICKSMLMRPHCRNNEFS